MRYRQIWVLYLADVTMRHWVAAIAGLLLSACTAPYGGPMTVGTGAGYGSTSYGVVTSPYIYGAPSPYYGNAISPWNSPYGFNSGNGRVNRFSPKKGLVCERSRNVCYDRYGVDYYETQKYLGSKSAKRGVKRYGEQAFIFAPQQGVVCDRRSQSCSDSSGLNAVLTRQYFSKDDTRRVANWTGADMFAPQAGVACSRTTQICSNNAGPNVHLTTLYLGQQAGLNLANQQNQPVPVAAPVMAPVVSGDPVLPAPAETPSSLEPAVVPETVAAPAVIDVLPAADPVFVPEAAAPEAAATPEPVSAPEPVMMPEPAAARAPEPAPMPEAPPAAAPEPAPPAACAAETCP